MTLNEARLLHAFNAWATQRIFDALAPLSAEQLTGDMRASHGSIHGTLTHLVGAEKMWLSRWVGKPDAAMLNAQDAPTTAALKAVWEKTGFETARWLGTLSDRKLQETFTMTAANGMTYRHTFAQALQHVTDHSTYHRGQIITLLRQLGVTPPSTGLIRFFRETAKLK
jgi:uncharacterized damage-inducible protein DinB